MTIFKNFFVSPQENEVISTKIHIDTDIKPAIIGSVFDSSQKPIVDAFVTIFEVDREKHIQKELVSYTYTDEFGTFALASLDANKLYNVKVFKNTRDPRVLEPLIEN